MIVRASCLMVLFMCIGSAAFAQQVPDVWLGCKKNADCSMVQSVCGAGMLPVNIGSKKKLQEHVAHIATMVKCAKPNKPVLSKPECMDAQCVVKVPAAPAPKAPPARAPKESNEKNGPKIIRYGAGRVI